jgi:putative endonuclease
MGETSEKKDSRSVGREYEEQAVRYLQKHGYEILERNFWSCFAELDVVAREGEYLCFVEVKYRRDARYGAPEGVISWKKIQNICKASEFYLSKKNIPMDTPIRYDVVYIVGTKIQLVRDAFPYCGRG